MKSIKSAKNLKGKKVLVRVDFNVPLKNGKVQDDFRIRKALPTIKFLASKGAKVILISHLGKGEESLLPVSRSLNKLIKSKFISGIYGPEVEKEVEGMKNGDIILLENLRRDAGEKDANKLFAMNLAQLADIYVNEAFPVSHRSDASIVVLPKLLPSYSGFQLEDEVKNLSHAFKKPKHPFVFILGGSKFSTKLPLIKKYLALADHVVIGGALLNDFLKAKGFNVGKSLVSDENFGIEKLIKSKKLILPEYVLVESGEKLVEQRVEDIASDEYIVDVGRKSIAALESIIKKSKLILWNGTLGRYENGGAQASKDLIKLISASQAESIVGGGDTVLLVSEMKAGGKISFVSSGGGATLDFLSSGTLPGIKALK